METQTIDTAKQTRTWNIDNSHSNIRFNVRHLVVSKVSGHFDKFTGIVTTEGNDFKTAKVNFEAETPSITTGVADRDTHLKSDDFFNAEQFPKLTFESTKITKVDDENYKMEGNLTLRDVTKPIVLDVEAGGVIKDPWGFERAGFNVKGKINRQEFGLKWNMAMEAGGLTLSDHVNIDCDVEFVTK